MAGNENQRVENVMIVEPSDRADAHAGVTKMRLWNPDGSPFALKGAENKARLDALEARIAALEGNTDEAESDATEGAADEQQEEPPAEPQQ